MNISVSNAIKIFTLNPTKNVWTPTKNFKKAFVRFEKENDIIKKIVQKDNGTVVIGHFKKGDLFKTTLENRNGIVTTEINRPVQKGLPARFQYEKSTEIVTTDGDKFCRYEDKTNGIHDTWCQKNGIPRGGRMDTIYRQYLELFKS